MTYLLLLDDRHLDDLLFVPALGRAMTGSKRRVVLVHGSGGQAERLLEADGYFPEAQHGAFPGATAEERARIEAGVRRTNRMLVGALTDAMVPAVGFHGGDRGLVRLEEGNVAAGRLGWLHALVEQGGVPVVSALVAGEEGGVLVPPGEVLRVLAAAWPGDAEAVVLTRGDRAGLGVPPASTVAASALEAHEMALSDPDAARLVASANLPLRATSVAGLFDGAHPVGTRIVTEKPG